MLALYMHQDTQFNAGLNVRHIEKCKDSRTSAVLMLNKDECYLASRLAVAHLTHDRYGVAD